MSTERCEFKKENGQSNVPTPTELESNLVPNVIRDVLSGNNTCVLYKNLPLHAEAHRHEKILAWKGAAASRWTRV